MDSFLTLGITVKMQAGIISIPAPCFIIVQKEKNLDPLEEKSVYNTFEDFEFVVISFFYPWLCQSPPIILYFPVKLTL